MHNLLTPFIRLFVFFSLVTSFTFSANFESYETFDSNIDGWSVSNSSKVYHSSGTSHGGSIYIDRRDTASRSYSYGASGSIRTIIEWCPTGLLSSEHSQSV